MQSRERNTNQLLNTGSENTTTFYDTMR